MLRNIVLQSLTLKSLNITPPNFSIYHVYLTFMNLVHQHCNISTRWLIPINQFTLRDIRILSDGLDRCYSIKKTFYHVKLHITLLHSSNNTLHKIKCEKSEYLQILINNEEVFLLCPVFAFFEDIS